MIYEIDDAIKIILSNPVKEYDFKKIIIKKIFIKEKIFYQIEKFTHTQVFHENILPEELLNHIQNYFPQFFVQLEIFNIDYKYSYRYTNKGKIISNKTINNTTDLKLSHNRQKKYLLSEDVVIPPLVELGIMDNTGKVFQAKYDKFKQINRFLEIIDDHIANEKQMTIIDFGCGKSYLSFILYYYLHEIKNMNIKLIGLDLKKSVIDECNRIKEKYHYDNMFFYNQDIKDFQQDLQIDMIITLHACDTATDLALYHAIFHKVKYIFSVPCCQHEVNQQLTLSKDDLLLKYGLIKERFSTLITDTIRASILEYFGYQVDVMEFIDLSHSAKNVLIRAVKKDISLEKKQKIKMQIESLIQQYRIKQTLFEFFLNNNT